MTGARHRGPMGSRFLTLRDLPLAGKKVLVRVDVNSPIDPSSGTFLDDLRFREHLPTLRALEHSAVVLLAHQSRPGKKDYTSLRPHAERMGHLLGRHVRFVEDLFGEAARRAIGDLKPGELLMLENTRFAAEEEVLADQPAATQAKSHFVRNLAKTASAYVNDAFAAAHRSQPSLTGFPEVLPSAAGLVMEKEVLGLAKALDSTEGPRLAILGGAKVDDSLDVAEHMLDGCRADRVLVTGAVANLFVNASGKEVGAPSTDFLKKELPDYPGLLDRTYRLLQRHGGRIDLPVDFALDHGGRREEVPRSALPAAYPVLDIGSQTVAQFAASIAKARVVILNGPAGVFELEQFAHGTNALFEAVAASDAYSVVGGGHTAAVLENLGLRDRIDHVSSGGGACITFLAGKPMPAVESLVRCRERFEKGDLALR